MRIGRCRGMLIIGVMLHAVGVSWGNSSYIGTVLYPVTWSAGDIYGPGIVTDVVDGQTVGMDYGTGEPTRAFVWNGPSGTFVNLFPPSATNTEALATDGNQQVGKANGQAMLWSGTSASAVNLNPVGYTNSIAFGIGGGQQVGAAQTFPHDVYTHAMMWTGSAASAVDLSPTGPNGYIGSQALATDGTHQVGILEESSLHAVLWSGTASSAIDLNPAGASSSQAFGVFGNQQVGSADSQAYLWQGTAQSAINLNPPGMQQSQAVGTNGVQQVGYGVVDPSQGLNHALVWSSTDASMVDLQLLLPQSGTWDYSWAFSIDPNGISYGAANGTYDGIIGTFATEWMPVPEPSTIMLVGVGCIILLCQRRTAISFHSK